MSDLPNTRSRCTWTVTILLLGFGQRGQNAALYSRRCPARCVKIFCVGVHRLSASEPAPTQFSRPVWFRTPASAVTSLGSPGGVTSRPRPGGSPPPGPLSLVTAGVQCPAVIGEGGAYVVISRVAVMARSGRGRSTGLMRRWRSSVR